MTIRALRNTGKIAAGLLAVVAIMIVGGKDSAFAAQSVTLSVPATTLTRGQLQASGALTSGVILDPGTTQTNGTFLASDMGVLRVGMVIQVENELMLVTALTEGGLNPDTITVNRGTAAGFDGAGVLCHPASCTYSPPGLTIWRAINFLPVNISTVTTEDGGDLTVALSADEFENTNSRIVDAINPSVTKFRVDNVAPMFTGRTLRVDAEKMLVADGGDPDNISIYPGWLLNSGATLSMLSDEHLAPGSLCNSNVDDDGDGLINDGCPAVGNTVVMAEAGAECADNVDENGYDVAGTGHEDDDGDGTHNEAFDDGDNSKINDGCPLNETTIRISNANLIAAGWTIKVDNEFMYVVSVQENGAIDTMTVNRGINSIITNHPAGAIIYGGWDEVEVQRGYAGTTAASHAAFAQVHENVRTLTVNLGANITEASHFQIDAEKFTAVTEPDAQGKVKAIRAILGTTMAAHNTVPAQVNLIDGLGGTGLTIDYATSHLDYQLMLPGQFLVSTGRVWDSGSCYAPVDNPGQVEVLCSTQGEFPLGALGSGTVMNVGFTTLAITPGSTSVTVTPSLPEAVDSSGDTYTASTSAPVSVKIFHCADFQTPPNFVVNAVDINQVRIKFNQSSGGANAIFDVNAAGATIDGVDINITRSQFNVRCYRP